MLISSSLPLLRDFGLIVSLTITAIGATSTHEPLGDESYDAAQMVEWLCAMEAPETAYVVHGEEGAAWALADRLASELGWNAVVPRYLERVRLT